MPAIPSPIVPADFQDSIPESTGSICTKLNALWSLANKVYEFFNWFLNADGTLSDNGQDFLEPASVPVGSVVFWLTDVVPDGWLALNGSTVSRTTYANLFAVWGTRYGSGDGSTTFGIPDARRRVPFGASGTNVAGSTGGVEAATIAVSNMPAHTHGLNEDVVTALIGNPASGGATATSVPGAVFTGLDDTDGDLLSMTGGGAALDILNPYLSAHWIVKV